VHLDVKKGASGAAGWIAYAKASVPEQYRQSVCRTRELIENPHVGFCYAAKTGLAFLYGYLSRYLTYQAPR